jgi:hypothetical protein
VAEVTEFEMQLLEKLDELIGELARMNDRNENLDTMDGIELDNTPEDGKPS